jgi:hypothetical protein
MPGMFKRFWRPETGIFLWLWLGLLVNGRSKLFHDPGTFWHTRVGERIFAVGFFDTDPFSCTFGGEPWVPHQWLGECSMAVVHAIGGLDGLFIATVTLMAGLYTWLAHRFIRGGLHWSLAAGVVALTVAAGSHHVHIRPHLITIVMLGVTTARLIDFEAGRIGRRQLLWLVPLYALWSNVHGGVLGGLATMVMALVGWTGWAILRRPTPLRGVGPIGWFAVLTLTCGATAFVNPYGVRLPAEWFAIMRSPRLGEIIVEHAPLKATDLDGVLVLLFGASYLFTLAGIGWRWPRVTWLLPLPWFVLACSGIRHTPLFAVTAALAIADMLPCTRWARWLARPGSDLFRFPAEMTSPVFDWRPALLPGALVMLALGLSISRSGPQWHRLDPLYWPADGISDTELTRALRRHASDGTPIFNALTWGGYLIYFEPRYHVFIDDRCELFANERRYGRELLARYDHVTRQDPTGFEPLLADCCPNVRLALLHRGSLLDEYLKRPGSGWRLEAASDSAALFVRELSDKDSTTGITSADSGRTCDR